MTIIMHKADPCPFCANPQVEVVTHKQTEEYSLRCMNCSACGPVTSSVKRATKLWNIRK